MLRSALTSTGMARYSVQVDAQGCICEWSWDSSMIYHVLDLVYLLYRDPYAGLILIQVIGSSLRTLARILPLPCTPSLHKPHSHGNLPLPRPHPPHNLINPLFPMHSPTNNPQFAQELISTFSTALGEVSLQPTTGGVFIVSVILPTQPTTNPPSTDLPATTATTTHQLWDRKVDGGFPETKELKRRLRDIIEPGRNLGHVDKDYGVSKEKVVEVEKGKVGDQGEGGGEAGKEKCEDCVP